MYKYTMSKILYAAYQAWSAGADLRARRNRYKRYTYGDQWSDLVRDSSGNLVPEGDAVESAGKKPLTNNLLRQLVKSIVGRFRSMDGAPAGEVAVRNQLSELDARLLEEFLISGCAIQRVTREHRPGLGEGMWVDNVSPARFFINSTSDPRAWDVQMLGMLHDMSPTEVIMRFAHGSRSRARQLTDIYASCDASAIHSYAVSLGLSINDSLDFFSVTGDRRRCRVIEVWTLESRERLLCHDRKSGRYYAMALDDESLLEETNASRLKMSQPTIDYRWDVSTVWHCRFYAPNGQLLDEMDSPYGHAFHPFAVKFYPLTDGEIHPFIEDVIDQQRYVNRLITLVDHIMSTSAKGVLLFPESQRTNGLTWEEIGKRWAQPNAIIPVRVKNGDPLPQQVSVNNTDMGAYQLLDLEMRLMEQVSGVSNAFQGRDVSARTAASLYQEQTHNSVIALTDIFQTFEAFRKQRDLLLSSA